MCLLFVVAVVPLVHTGFKENQIDHLNSVLNLTQVEHGRLNLKCLSINTLFVLLNCRHKFKIGWLHMAAAYSPIREIVYRTRLTFLAVVTGSTKGQHYFAVEWYAWLLTAFSRKWQRIWKSEFMRSFPKLYRWAHMLVNAVALDSQFKTKKTKKMVLWAS